MTTSSHSTSVSAKGASTPSVEENRKNGPENGVGVTMTQQANTLDRQGSTAGASSAISFSGDASSPKPDAKHSMHATHSAHHLKYGAIKTAGFVPHAEGFDEEDLAVCGAQGIRDSDIRREILDAEARRIHANRRYLFRKPRALQYFRGKTLVRSDEERSSQRLELFFDLIFVGIIAVLAHACIQQPTGAGLVRYLISYSMAWIIWSIYRELNDTYWNGDVYQCTMTLYVMAMLVVFGNNAQEIQQNLSEGPARATSIGAYLLAQLGLYGTFLFYSFYVKAYRAQIRAHVAMWPITTALWIGAIFVEVRPAIAMAVLALSLEYGVWLFVYSPGFKRMMKLRYSSAVAIEHEAERMSDFVTLVLGEAVYSIVYGHPAGTGVTRGTGRAILSLCVAFSFLMLYIHGSQSKRMTHPLRRSVPTALLWLTVHIPFVSALTLFGDAAGDMVAEEVAPQSIRWILCGSYSVAMLTAWAFAMMEGCEDENGHVWISRCWRVLPRLIAAIIAVFLPLSYYHEAEASSAASLAGEPTASVQAGAAGMIELAGYRRAEAAGVASEMARAEAEATAALGNTALIGILAAFSLSILLWEWISALDGPKTEQEEAPESMRGGDKYTPPHALKTPTWAGVPTIFEPGFMHFDKSHQRTVDTSPEEQNP